MWLLNKLFDQGDQPTPRFAFLGTVNWMRGLSLLCRETGFSHTELKNLYSKVKRRNHNEEADILSFECLLMAMHNVSALESASQNENPYTLVRSAIIAWYYATYYASKAMLAASTGANPQTHAKTGKIWQADVLARGLVQEPFNLSIVNLTPKNISETIKQVRGNNVYDLSSLPANHEMALGAAFSYLKGTAEYEKWRLEEQVKSSSEFRNSDFSNFRTKAAKELRDNKLIGAHVNYLVQAFRYRGKANYRDAIYLSYGADNTDTLLQFIEDLEEVAGSFVLMAAHYIACRVEKNNWDSFANDLNQYAKFTLPFDSTEI